MTDTEYKHCLYGAGIVASQLDALESLFAGTEQGIDIEYVHKTRVMLRRLRTSLRLFDDCFKGGENKKYFKAFRNAAKNLGKARDLDVKIQHLEENIKKSAGRDKASIDLLLIEHRDDRKLIQPQVALALRELLDSGSVAGLRESCKKILEKKTSPEVQRLSDALMYSLSCEKINCKIKEVLELEQYAKKENEALMHHKLRIAIKHLRYSLETYSQLYGNGFSHEINRLKKMQDTLGEMHDCDAWLHDLEGMSSDEGIKEFLSSVKLERKKFYKEFILIWNKTKKEKLFDKIGELAYSRYIHERRKDAAAVEKAGVKYGSEGGHSSQVKSLSLQLFDGLVKVHGLGPEERFLLESSAILHDIGWSSGQKSHHKTSMELIMADEELPLSKKEKQIVASIARYHRKRLPKKTDANLAGLAAKERKTTEKLAAILRIADALDASHHSVVNSLAIKTVRAGTAITSCSSGNYESEKQSFLEKKDLFEKTFKTGITVEWRQAR